MGPPLAPAARPDLGLDPRYVKVPDEPRLHAYPDGSNVALCGKTRKPGDERATATSFCKACERMASSVNHRG
jgi:hypothetical protein